MLAACVSVSTRVCGRGRPLVAFHNSHTFARIVTAAVYADAEHIVDGVIGLKQRALELALADGAAGAAAA